MASEAKRNIKPTTKKKKSRLTRAKKALMTILELSSIHFNDRKFVEITNLAKYGLNTKD